MILLLVEDTKAPFVNLLFTLVGITNGFESGRMARPQEPRWHKKRAGVSCIHIDLHDLYLLYLYRLFRESS